MFKSLYKRTPIALLSLVLGLFLGVATSSAVSFSGVHTGVFSTVSATGLGADAADIEQSISCPDLDASHSHGFVNTSTPRSGWESYFFAHKLRIYLHDDFMNSVDLSSMTCTVPSGTVPCDGGSSSGYGGVTVNLVENDHSSDAVYPNYIEWTYGVTDATGRPMVQGKNDYNGDGTVDSSADDESERDFGESVNYSFTGDDSSASATTTASLYVAFYEYEQSCGDFGDTSCWEAVEENGETGLHWNDNDTDTIRTNYSCAALTCDHLDITPTSDTLGVSDVFSDVPFTVTAVGSDGSDITADSTFQYYVNQYGSANTAADASGYLNYGWFSRGRSPNTTDSTVTFKNTEPGDSLYVYVSDYDGNSYQSTCNASVELPYCADLSMDPSGVLLYSTSSFNTNISVEATASNGEVWPYSITYDSTDDSATYDGNADPYNTTDYTVDDYESTSTGSETLTVTADNDVANQCSDSFTYGYYPSRNTCRDLTITTAGPISAADMAAGNVEISWTSTMVDGTTTPPPYICTSSNGAGTFVDSIGVRGTGSIVTMQNTVYYTGTPGDTVICSSPAYPACTDTITSDTSSTSYTCNNTTLSDPYITTDGGVTKTTLDLTNDADVSTLYDNTTVCYDYTVSVSDAAFSDTLQAAGYVDSTRADPSGNLVLTVDQTLASSVTNPAVGNPARIPITGYTTYTGTLCWENYEPGNYVDLQVIGHPLVCYEDSQLPTPSTTDTYACTDLALSPDNLTLAMGVSDAGTQNGTVTLTADDAAWSGTLMITKSGSGALYYADGTASTAGDGHLEVPVSGLSQTVTFTYIGGKPGDLVTAYISGETSACSDNFTITQETPGGGGGGGGGGGSGGGGGGSSGGGESCTVDVTEESSDTISSCSDYQMQVCTDGDDVTVVNDDNNETCYYLDEDGDGHQDSDEELTCEYGDVTLEDNNDCYEVTVKNVCSHTTISVEQNGETCYDNTVTTTASLGSFNKYIYTFNFSAEKNSYSDQGIFFAHDEDRAFYTLEYRPSGEENDIVFTDDMWTHGYLGAEDGGRVDLATSYDELTSGRHYTYREITNLGFGDKYEENSEDLASYVSSHYSSSSYMSYVPYIKYDNGSESAPIDECQYDPTSGDLINTDVCYDPSESPEGSHEVVIKNADTVNGDDEAIRVRYVGIIDSKLDCTSDTDHCLTEEFTNNATVWDSSDSGNTLDAHASLVVLCSYLLTENAGDVYLNEAIQGGSDLACINVESSGGSNYSGYSNTEGLIISPDTTITSTSTGITPYYASETISSCDSNSDGSLIGNLSSYVCEIVTSVSDLWKKSSVETTTDSHVSQAIRNASTNQTSATMTVRGGTAASNWQTLASTLSNSNNADNHILYFNGTYGGASSGTLTLYSIEVPCGAWTLIVDQATLDIAGDISYATSCSDGSNISQNLPSIAFVVQGGDIKFETSSYHNVGVYYTDQDLTGEERSPVNGQLTIDGSLYGNVQPLVDACRYVAPPTTEGGGLVVRYDSRILLNTPPSLSEYVDVSTEKGIN